VTNGANYYFKPLNRLTEADYSTGQQYHYKYDPVGNRVEYSSSPSGTITYDYDAANRLTRAGTTNYTWDNNGNLLNDGVSDYTYNYANQLTHLVQGQSSFDFAYRCNGLSIGYGSGCESDRVSQTVDGVTTPLRTGSGFWIDTSPLGWDEYLPVWEWQDWPVYRCKRSDGLCLLPDRRTGECAPVGGWEWSGDPGEKLRTIWWGIAE
jgi:hypothetical protein